MASPKVAKVSVPVGMVATDWLGLGFHVGWLHCVRAVGAVFGVSEAGERGMPPVSAINAKAIVAAFRAGSAVVKGDGVPVVIPEGVTVKVNGPLGRDGGGVEGCRHVVSASVAVVAVEVHPSTTGAEHKATGEPPGTFAPPPRNTGPPWYVLAANVAVWHLCLSISPPCCWWGGAEF